MARELGINRCWFHARSRFPHYDIPKRRIAEISAKCTVVSSRDILDIVRGTYLQEQTHREGLDVLDDGEKNSETPDSGS